MGVAIVKTWFACFALFLMYCFVFQTIQGKFEDFKRSVMAKAERFNEVDNFAKRLVAEGHTDTVIIKEQQDILRCLSFVIVLFYNI